MFFTPKLPYLKIKLKMYNHPNWAYKKNEKEKFVSHQFVTFFDYIIK